MAEAAATHSADALPSPSSVNGSQQPWDLSVPVGQEQNSTNSISKSPTSNDSTTPPSKPILKHNHIHAVNGATVSRNSSRSGSRQGHINESNYLLPNRVDALGRRETSLSRTGSESDSLLDLYARDSANRSAVSVMESGERKAEGLYPYGDEDPDNSNWIHRDKLARIESEELQQFGIQLQRQVRAGSKSSSRRGPSHDSHNHGPNGVTEAAEQWDSSREEKRPRIASPVPVEDLEHENSDDGEPVSFDVRLPEEIAADPYEDGGVSRVYRIPGVRKSSSRIPVLASSPLPIPQEQLERDYPLQRTRNNTSGSRDDESITYGKTRGASESTPAATDPPEAINATPPQESRPGSSDQTQNSPSKPKLPAKQAPSTARKSSAPANSRKASGQSKPKATASSSKDSNPNNTQRPVTRSGENRPPTAVNRPEGDPPWLATMYKPDPRLPPDQQILPTHAKKLQREQWEREGKLPSTYDRTFGPLAIRDEKDTSVSEGAEKAQTVEVVAASPPLSSPMVSDGKPTGATDHDGYKAMPKVKSPTSGTSQSPQSTPKTKPVENLPAETEKGCGCCIVM